MYNEISQVLADNEVIKNSAQFVIDVEKNHGKLPQIQIKIRGIIKASFIADCSRKQITVSTRQKALRGTDSRGSVCANRR